MDQEKKRFAWGLGLAWLPVLLAFGPGLFNAFRGISQERATGLAAVAGGFAEAAAIVLLARGMRREEWGRSMVAVVSIVSSVGILALTALATWWLWHVSGIGTSPSGPGVRLWVPESAALYIAYRGHRYERVHTFDHFHLFSVDSDQAIKEPAAPPKTPLQLLPIGSKLMADATH
jgi:hypothetical protein